MAIAQDYIPIIIREDAILTNSFVDAIVLGEVTDTRSNHTALKNQLMLYVDFTLGSLTSLELRFEFSPDGVTYYRETEQSAVSTGVVTSTPFDHTFTATAADRLALPIKDAFVKISAKGVGTLTSSTLKLTAALGIG